MGILKCVFLTPDMHKVHHSSNPDHFNASCGDKLLLFDWLFGKALKLDGERDMPLLKYGIQGENPQGFFSQLISPFRRSRKRQ